MNNKNSNKPFSERVAEFMYGRNGVDEFYRFLFWIIIILTLVNIYFKHWVVSVTELLLLSYMIFRVLSRNIYRRQKENKIYLDCVGKIKGIYRRISKAISSKIDLAKSKWRDRATHVYKKCPRCKNTLRLPKNKGKHIAACPCCNNRFDVNIL